MLDLQRLPALRRRSRTREKEHRKRHAQGPAHRAGGRDGNCVRGGRRLMQTCKKGRSFFDRPSTRNNGRAGVHPSCAAQPRSVSSAAAAASVCWQGERERAGLWVEGGRRQAEVRVALEAEATSARRAHSPFWRRGCAARAGALDCRHHPRGAGPRPRATIRALRRARRWPLSSFEASGSARRRKAKAELSLPSRPSFPGLDSQRKLLPP